MGEFNHDKWNAAAIRFCEFVRNLPIVVDEEDIATYNEIVKELEESSQMDLSRFRARAVRTETNRDLTLIIHVSKTRKASVMVQSRCLGGFETNRRLSLERTYHNTVFVIPRTF